MDRRTTIFLAFAALWVAVGAVAIFGLSSNDAGTGDVATSPGNSSPVASDAPSTTSTTSTTSTSTTTTTTTIAPRVLLRDAVEVAVDQLSLEHQVGQLFMTGLDGAAVRAAEAELATAWCLGGVFVVDSTNGLATAEASVSLATGLTDAVAAGCEVAPFVSTDQEGGRVAKYPPAVALRAPVAYGDQSASDYLGAIDSLRADAGADAAALGLGGLNVNLAPSVDTDRVGGQSLLTRQGRSFSADSTAATDLGLAFIEAHCAAGIVPVAKHFPNHGATAVDSHKSEATVFSEEQLRGDQSFVPFEQAIAAGVPMIMTGHLRIEGSVEPDGTSGLPATASFDITTRLLRNDLGFNGIVITDDLSGMAGITRVFPDPGARSVQIVRAGADILLWAVGPTAPDVKQAYAAVLAEAQADDTFRARVRESAVRIVDLKARMGLVGLPGSEAFADVGMCLTVEP